MLLNQETSRIRLKQDNQLLNQLFDKEEDYSFVDIQAITKTKVVYVYLKLSKALDLTELQTSLVLPGSVRDWVREVLFARQTNYSLRDNYK